MICLIYTKSNSWKNVLWKWQCHRFYWKRSKSTEKSWWWAYLHAGHTSRVVGWGVAEGDVGNELESELPGVQQLHQGLVLLVAFHGLLHHDSGVEDLLQHAGQDAFTHRWLNARNTRLRSHIKQSTVSCFADHFTGTYRDKGDAARRNCDVVTELVKELRRNPQRGTAELKFIRPETETLCIWGPLR